MILYKYVCRGRWCHKTFLHWHHCHNRCGVCSWLGIVVASIVVVSPVVEKIAREGGDIVVEGGYHQWFGGGGEEQACVL